MRFSKLPLLLPLLALTSCQSSTGARWYAPATWFSHAPVDKLDGAERKEEAAREAAVKSAQRSAHETSLALASAPPSRAVAVATDSNASTVALLDQAAGPLKAGDLEKLRALVAGLLSENAEIRAKAERQQAEERGRIAEVSAALAKAEAKTEEAGAKLRRAFERENELANELRAQRAFLWIAVTVSVLLAAAWFYVRTIYGGLPLAAGKLMRDLRASHPDAAKIAETLFDAHLNRGEQEMIARNSR